MDPPTPFRTGFVEDVNEDVARAASRWTDEVHGRVHRLSGFDPDGCLRLAGLLEERRTAAEAQRGKLEPPNALHRAGFGVAACGLGPALEGWISSWLRPLATELFPDFGGASLDGLYGFVADYGDLDDNALDFHVDDSEVTLNLCLDGDFDGSELYFRGLRCDAHRQNECHPTEAFELEHRPGTAILHAGRHRHGVHPIMHGSRRNLILWLTSSTYRADPQAGGRCASWCGSWAGARPA